MVRTGLATLGALAVAAALVACSSGRTSDRDLGGLVVAPEDRLRPVELPRAVRDPAELGRAIALPHHEVARLLGPHVTTQKSAVVVHEGANQVDALTTDTTIELGDAGAWHAVSDNDADYGREAIWSGGELFLRPRYARWHRRAPNDEQEPIALKDEYASELAAVWELLAPGIELTDKGARTVAGRTGRVIEVKLAPSPRKPAPEPLSQRAWRESRTIEAVAGEVVLDAEHGVPLAIKLTGKLAYVRDGKRYTMTIDASHAIRDVGQLAAITLPPEDETVATPGRFKDVDDRDALLKGIAPPVRAQAEDEAAAAATAAANAPATAGSGAAKP